MFRPIGAFAARFPVPIVLGWIVVLIAVLVTTPSLSSVISSSQAKYLPASANSQQAAALLRKAFPQNPASSALVVVTGPPNARNAAVAALSNYAAHQLTPAPSSVASSSLPPQLRPQWESRDGAASMIMLGWAQPDTSVLPTNSVNHLRAYIAAHPYPGVIARLTGDVPINVDYQAQVNKSTSVTTIATVALVIIIMLLLFRSPILPLVPLLTIGLSVMISRGIVALFATHGMVVSQNTPIFMIVLLAGAGTDYCLFLASRYKEELQNGVESVEAVITTVTHVGASIASSGVAVIVGLGGMAFARYGLFNTTGPAVAISVAITLVIGLTLAPALLTLLGRRAFWPTQVAVARPSRFWGPLSRWVTGHPIVALLSMLVILLPLNAAVLGTRQSFNFLTDLNPTVEARAGYDTINQHYGVGNTQPQIVVIAASHSLRNAVDLARLDALNVTLADLPGIVSVQGPTRPAGQPIPYQADAISPQIAAAMARNLSATGRVAQFTVVGTADPYSTQARALAATVQATAIAAFPLAQVHSAGTSVYTADTKSVIQDDTARIALFVFGGILLVLIVLLRSLVAPIYLLVTVALSFGATLGLTTLAFQDLGGQPGLAYWVPILVLVFLIGLGIDYSILLMSRVREEAAKGGVYREAVAYAVERTGAIISSCGLILAGSFGTLVLASVTGLRENGFAVGVGIMMDTFLIRSILVPSIVVIFGQVSWFPGRLRGAPAHRAQPPVMEVDAMA